VNQGSAPSLTALNGFTNKKPSFVSIGAAQFVPLSLMDDNSDILVITFFSMI